MSSRRLPVVLSPDANLDFADILLYGLETWGDQQTAAYEAETDRALERLGTYPELGRQRDDLGAGYRTYRVRQHVVIYRVEDAAIIVLRIVHGRADIASAIGDPPPGE
jgi:toxin ParE1/3/4